MQFFSHHVPKVIHFRNEKTWVRSQVLVPEAAEKSQVITSTSSSKSLTEKRIESDDDNNCYYKRGFLSEIMSNQGSTAQK